MSNGSQPSDRKVPTCYWSCEKVTMTVHPLSTSDSDSSDTHSYFVSGQSYSISRVVRCKHNHWEMLQVSECQSLNCMVSSSQTFCKMSLKPTNLYDGEWGKRLLHDRWYCRFKPRLQSKHLRVVDCGHGYYTMSQEWLASVLPGSSIHKKAQYHLLL
jgi:hypothetical protein